MASHFPSSFTPTLVHPPCPAQSYEIPQGSICSERVFLVQITHSPPLPLILLSSSSLIHFIIICNAHHSLQLYIWCTSSLLLVWALQGQYLINSHCLHSWALPVWHRIDSNRNKKMKTTLIPKIVQLSFQITVKSQWTSKIILLGGKSLKKRKISTIIQII